MLDIVVKPCKHDTEKTSVSAKFIGWLDKYEIGPICLISSWTEMSDVASNTQSQTDISSVL